MGSFSGCHQGFDLRFVGDIGRHAEGIQFAANFGHAVGIHIRQN